MKTTRNYTINVIAKEIVMTKAFEKKASKVGTDEYNELVALMRDFPTFTIKVKDIKKKAGKKTYKGLTVAEMRRFIATVGEKEVRVFDKVVEIAKQRHQTGSYAVVKKWFLNNYKDLYEAELERIAEEQAEAEATAALELVELEAEDTEVEEIAC